MPLKIVEWYTRPEIQANPQCLYVFGDNFERRGLAGQAREARGEENAVGIATKRSPIFQGILRDDDYDEWEQQNSVAYLRIEAHLANGGVVVWPKSGIGTGFAQLSKWAPRIWDALEGWRMSWEERYGRS